MRITTLRQAMLFGLYLTLAIGVNACGGSSTNTVPVQTVSPASTFSVVAASNTFCVPVSAVAQTVALPPTGGFTGTITVGPVSATRAVCVPFTFSTGADVIAQSTARAATEGKRQPLFCGGIIQTICAQLTPIAQVLEGAVGGATVPNISVTLSTTSLGTQLGSQFSALSCIADATDGVDTADQTLSITEQGVTATFGPIGSDQGLSFSAVVVKYALTALCGINIPLPAMSRSPSPSPSPSLSPSPSPSPTASPTVAPAPSPTPASVSAAACSTMPYVTKCGTVTVSGVLDGGPNAGAVVTPAPQQVSYTGLSPGTDIGIPAYFAGTVTIAIPNMYPGMQQYVQITTCPSTILAQSGVNGSTYTLTLPANGQAINLPATGNSTQTGCSFAVTNVPPGAIPSIESGFYIDYTSTQ